MIYGPNDSWESAVFFPVEERRVYYEAAEGHPRFSHRYKAIVNGFTGRMIAVVGDRYRVLANERALDWGRFAARIAFPETEDHEWRVTRVEAPLTGGSCCIDLGHPRTLTGREWRLGRRDERFTPLIRVRNGYNGKTAFSIFWGVIRVVCENAMIVGDGAKFYHEGDMEARIAKAFDPTGVLEEMDLFRDRLARLEDQPIPREYFPPIVRRALAIRWPSGGLKPSQREDWVRLHILILSQSHRYVRELGATAYALWNAISDIATRPPSQNQFVRRTSHSLQRLANRWLIDFDRRIRDPRFDLVGYVSGPDGSNTSAGAV